MTNRLFGALVVLTLVIAACSSAASRPAEFDGMETGQVGCTARVGDEPLHTMGPVGPAESDVFAPWDGYTVRIAQQAFGVVVTVAEDRGSERGTDVSVTTTGWDGLPVAGKGAAVAEAGLGSHQTSVGYIVRCWKGHG